MATPSRKIFVNLAVRDVQKSIDFFTALGFDFNKQFTDEKAACMVVSGEAFVMLLGAPYFKTFTTREVADTSRHTEVLLAVSCGSKVEVDAMVEKAIAADGAPAMDSQDHGFMYVRSFYDIDGHHWEIMWMDPQAAQ